MRKRMPRASTSSEPRSRDAGKTGRPRSKRPAPGAAGQAESVASAAPRPPAPGPEEGPEATGAPAFIPEDRTREMVDGALDAVVGLDPAGRVLEFNPSAERIFGYSRLEALGRELAELIIPPALRSAEARGLGELLAGPESRLLGQRVELIAMRRDGSRFPVELAITRLHSCNPPCFAAWLRDISERRLVEIEMQKLAAFPRLNPQAIFEFSPGGTLTYFNDAALELARSVGKRHPSGILPHCATEMVDACLQTGRSLLHHESEAAGRVFSWSFHPTPASQAVHAYASDVTERQRAEEQIREQAALLDQAQDAILVRDLDHRILYWNRGAERVFGWTAAEVIGRSSLELFGHRDGERYLNALRVVLDLGEWSGELQYPAKGGALIDLQSRWTLVRGDEGQPKSVLVISTDITQKKQLEAQFLRAQRLESIGALASGIAHDLNNILAPIMMSVDLLQENITEPPGLRMLETVRLSVQRGADMVRQILSFTRGQDADRTHVDLRHLVAETARIAGQTFPRQIRVTTDAAADLWPVQGNPTQIHQVLMNLAVNGRDAMPDGGVLEVRADNVRLEAGAPDLPTGAPPGPYIRVTVADTGTGIPQEVLPRIWEPFFTLKPEGVGTGLGLSTVLSIATAHGGFVRVESAVGRGSRFFVFLPAGGSPGQAEAPEPAEFVPQGQGQQILLVDDEHAFREIARAIFMKHGYRVLTASDGAEAVEIFSRHPREIDLVMTDLVMPCLDGQATIEALRRIDPGVPILAASGLSENEKRAGELGHAAFLQKPFTTERLLQTVAHLLAPPAGHERQP